ncbi:MAG: SDR family NAD(P)-dependent oxidoreductase [Rhodospirillaceae bacterium]|nr:SDR family NAD(P)-dependent oxidoreductase [Rhodospirillaceae bacterium]
MAMLLKILQFYGRFLLSFSAIGFWWRQLFWPPFKPDFSGQTWLVTGASGGLGKAIVQAAAKSGATVLAAARSEAKLKELVADSGSAGANIIPVVADLSLVKDTAAMIDKLNAEGRKIDVLMNNVGLLLDDLVLTAEGRETTFATNILTHFQLTERGIETGLLKPDAVVVNMSSGGMYNAPLLVSKMNVTDPKQYRGVFAYAVHKRGQAELTKYWAQKYRAMKFYVMHPGWAKTDGVKTALPRFYKILNLVLRDGHQGTDTAIWLAATKPNCEPGAFWLDRAPRESHAFAMTRITKNLPADLVDSLSKELAKG